MDLASLVTACSIAFDRDLMQSLIWEQTQARPWSFQLASDVKPRSYPNLLQALEAARKLQPNDGMIRVGLTGLQVDLNAASAQPNEAMFAPCPNITIASERLRALEDRCGEKAEFKSNPALCAIAAWHGSYEHPDTKFAGAVMLAAVTSSTPDPELPNDFGNAPSAPTGNETVPSNEADSSASSPLLREIQASDDERRRHEFERTGGGLFPPNLPVGNSQVGAKSDAQSHGPNALPSPSVGAMFVPTGGNTLLK